MPRAPPLPSPGIVAGSTERPRPRLAGVPGFSLVEVLVASALLVTGVAALVQLFAIASRATGDARDTTIASVLAEQKMEELRSAAFAAAPPGESVEHLTGFVRRSRIEPLPLHPEAAVVITVEVWRPGRQPSVSRLITVKARDVP